MRVLVTGATGLVGSEIVERLADRGDEVVGVARRPVAGRPVVAWDIGVQEPPPTLLGPWTAIVHAAADTRWTMSPDEARRANVDTVAALVPLVSPHTHVVHVSTAYAMGLRGDVASEDQSDYRNAYEWSKAAAERLAQSVFARLTIVRPPLIIGRRDNGHAARFAGMYTILRGIASSTVPAVVAAQDAFFDVVPVDDVVALLVAACDGEESGKVLTIAGGDRAPRVGKSLDLLGGAYNEWRTERGLDPFDPPPIVTPASWQRFFLPFVQQHLTERQRRILELLENFLPYLAICEPLEPTHVVHDVEPCIARSVRHWAETNVRLASSPPAPWEFAA